MRVQPRQAGRSLGAGTTQPSAAHQIWDLSQYVAPVRSAASVLLQAPNSGVVAVLISSARQGAFGQDSVVWVVSWNLNYRGVSKTGLQGELLGELKPDLILLAETSLLTLQHTCTRPRREHERPRRRRGSSLNWSAWTVLSCSRRLWSVFGGARSLTAGSWTLCSRELR
jgi:hypothetical protein